MFVFLIEGSKNVLPCTGSPYYFQQGTPQDIDLSNKNLSLSTDLVYTNLAGLLLDIEGIVLNRNSYTGTMSFTNDVKKYITLQQPLESMTAV